MPAPSINLLTEHEEQLLATISLLRDSTDRATYDDALLALTALAHALLLSRPRRISPARLLESRQSKSDRPLLEIVPKPRAAKARRHIKEH